MLRRATGTLLISLAVCGLLLPSQAAWAKKSQTEHAYTNRLIHEKSPYLLQHAHNPVDWFPWGPEAFEKARKEGKMIFLSIGYSTCHWCHVMERESFEDLDVAAVLNKHFVAIKVDREERPDIDQVYMKVCQMLTGSGGWPLNLLLTPDRLPFFAGTYFPKETRQRRMGLIELLNKAQQLWTSDPQRLKTLGANLVKDLSEVQGGERASQTLSAEIFGKTDQLFRERFDPKYGGFGGAPKFPSPHNLVYLIRRHRRTGDPESLRMAEVTLQAMQRGGIYDHVGFGFHRYSTDAKWLVPHFEKMLYDQAGLAQAYLEAYEATRDESYAKTAREIFTYVLRDMTDERGGFYSAEDADSEGVEGKFYVWTRSEVLDLLGPEDGELFAAAYGLTGEGNYHDEASRRTTGKNILHIPGPSAKRSRPKGMTSAEWDNFLEDSRQKLFEVREKRIRPHLDDKVVTAWNGWMISALARGGRVLDEPGYAKAAGRAADFILTEMQQGGRLLRRYRDGEAAIQGYAEDYAFLARGLLDLYAATYDPARLEQALDMADKFGKLFVGDDGGLFATASDAEELVFRPREVYDGASPSANSIAIEVFARLYLLTGDHRWNKRAEGVLGAFGATVRRFPAGYTHFLQGASFLLEPTREIVIAGAPGAPDTLKLLEALKRSYIPEAVSLLAPPVDEGSPISSLAPFTLALKPLGGRATAYVCQNFACQEPMTDPERLMEQLKATP